MDVAAFLVNAIRGGLGNLAAYLAAHVLLCLLPAFYIAGAMTALIPKESVTRFLGRDTRRVVSYPAAALAGGCWRCVLARSCRFSPASTKRAPASARRSRFFFLPLRPTSWRWFTPVASSASTWPWPDCFSRLPSVSALA